MNQNATQPKRTDGSRQRLIISAGIAVAGILMIEIPRYFGNPPMKQAVSDMLFRAQMEHYPSPYTHGIWGLAGSLLLLVGAFFLLKSRRHDDVTISKRSFGVLLTCVVIAGMALRLLHYIDFPHGLWIDNGMAGLHGLTVLKYRELPIYFHTNYGYEPIMLYMITACIAILGNSAIAIRLPAILVAFLTILVTVRFTRAHYDRFTSVASTAFLAFSLCHIVLSRQGFRCILMPLFAVLIVEAMLQALDGKTPRSFSVAGIWLGLSIYSYVAIRFFIFIPILMIFHHMLTRRMSMRDAGGAVLRVFIPAAVVVAPLMIFFFYNPNLFSGRAMSTVVFNQPHPWQELLHNTRQILGMFFLAGDLQPRHNVMALPLFNPIESLCFMVGLLVVIRRFRILKYGTLLLWMAVMMVPSWITEGAPSFMRLLSMFPAAFLIAAVGLRETVARVQKFVRPPQLILILVLLAGWSYSYHSIFAIWKHSLETMPDNKRSHYGFCEDEYDLAQLFNADTEKEFIVSPQIFLHPSVQYLCYGKKGLILISDPDDPESYIRDKDSAVFVYTSVERNLWWLRTNREKDFFAWEKREYQISDQALRDVLTNHYGTHLPVMASDSRMGKRLQEIYPDLVQEQVGIFTVMRYQRSAEL